METFRCPICRATQYILRGKSRSGSSVYECHGCTALFGDPVKFTRFEPFPPGKDTRHQGELPPVIGARPQTTPTEVSPAADSDRREV